MERTIDTDRKRIALIVESMFRSEIELLPRDQDFIAKQVNLIQAGLLVTRTILSARNTKFTLTNSTGDITVQISTGNKSSSVKSITIKPLSKLCYITT